MTLARWQNSIEQIMLAAAGQQERVLGLTSLRSGAGVSLVCHHIARTAAAGEFKTLLLDISEPQTRDAPVRTWRPGYDRIGNLITPTVGRYDYLKVRTDEATRPLFSNPARLRSVYRTEFEQYALVIVDLPPLLEPTELGPNAVAAAGSCDQVLLLCAVGRDTRRELAEAISLVGGAGGRLAGLISNEFLYEQPLEHMGRLAGLFRIVPRVALAPLIACRWIVVGIARAITSATANTVDAVKALLRAAYWVVCLPVRALRLTATGIAAAGSWTWANLVGAAKSLIRATVWVALLPVRAVRWTASCVAAAGSWTWTQLVGGAKGLIRATVWVVLLPVRAVRWTASCIAAAGSWTWAKFVGAAKGIISATVWVALLPIRAARGIAIGVAAAGSWTWAKFVGAAKSLLSATLWVTLLPVRAMRWIATLVGTMVSWMSSQVAAGAKSLLRGIYWLARQPLVALRGMATCVVTATSWTAMKLVLAATHSLRAAAWVGYQPVAALLWIANCVRRTAAWTAAKLVDTAKALLAAARWLVRLPVAACRLLVTGVLAAATKISDGSLRFGRGALGTARHLWNLPSRLVGLLPRAAERPHQPLAPDVGHRNVRGLQKAGVLSVSLGGAVLVAMAALDPLGWSAEKGNLQVAASLGVARPPMLKTAALDVSSYGGELSVSDVLAVLDLPASRTDGPPEIQAHAVATGSPPAAQPDRRGQQQPAAAAPDEPAPPTPEPVRPPAVAISTPAADDRLQRTGDSPSVGLPDAKVSEMSTAAPREGSVETTSTLHPDEPNNGQPKLAAESSAPVVVTEAAPAAQTPSLPEKITASTLVPAAQLVTETDQPPASTAMIARSPSPEPSAQQADPTTQPPANAVTSPASAAGDLPAPPATALSEPTSEQTGQPQEPAAPIVVAVGPGSSPATVAIPLDSNSLAPPAEPADPTRQLTASLPESPVVAVEVSPAVDAPHLTPAAESEPASEQTGQAAAPITIAAASSEAPVATVVTPPDSGSSAPPAGQVDQQAEPAPQAMTQAAENVAAVVPSPAPPAISSPTLTDKGGQTDSPAPVRGPTLSPKERERAEQMVARGLRDLADGNVAQARLFFLNAAKAGLSRGALLLAATYDPRELSRPSILGVQPNIALARQWYERARELGAPEAAAQLAGLAGK